MSIINFNKLSKRSTIFFATIFCFGHLLCITGKAQANETKPGIFYAVSGNGLKDTSWLFGTYHLVKSSYLDKLPRVQQAFDKSKGLVVEIVIDSSKMLELQSMGLLKDNTLGELLDKPFSDSLDTELKNTIGVGLAQMNQLKPMTLTITLSMVYLMKNNNSELDKYSGLPLDVGFASDGKQAAKTITALESVAEQMDLLFNKTPLDEQVNQLKIFLRNKDEMISLGDELLQGWFQQDMGKMYATYEKTTKISGDVDYLVSKRNEKWMQVLPGLIKNEPQFIAVGALHLAGPTGLVEQLKQLGYNVTPIKL